MEAHGMRAHHILRISSVLTNVSSSTKFIIHSKSTANSRTPG